MFDYSDVVQHIDCVKDIIKTHENNLKKIRDDYEETITKIQNQRELLGETSYFLVMKSLQEEKNKAAISEYYSFSKVIRNKL